MHTMIRFDVDESTLLLFPKTKSCHISELFSPFFYVPLLSSYFTFYASLACDTVISPFSPLTQTTQSTTINACPNYNALHSSMGLNYTCEFIDSCSLDDTTPITYHWWGDYIRNSIPSELFFLRHSYCL